MNLYNEIKKGDIVLLVRTFTKLNGWSIKPELDNAKVEVIDVENRENGIFTFKMPDGDGNGLAFPDAYGGKCT